MIINLKMNEPGSYYQMPPVGITETRVRIGQLVHTQQTVRCGNRNCWWVGNAANPTDANLMLHDHQTTNGSCPQAPARNELPSGYSTIEKMWDELDDVTWAIMEKTGYQAGDQYLDNNLLRGYARGLAFSLSMVTHPHFRTIRDIVVECTARYKIRKGTLEFRPTPTYRFNPTPPPAPPEGERQAYHGKTVEAKPVVRSPRAARAAAKKDLASTADLGKLSAQQSDAIRQAYAAGFFSKEELSTAYKVSVMTISVIVGS